MTLRSSEFGLKARLQLDLQPVWIWLLVGFAAEIVIFSIIYSLINKGRLRLRNWGQYFSPPWIGKMALFSVIVSTPGIDPLETNWHRRLGVEAEKLSILVFTQRFLGWGALVLGGAVIVAVVIE